MTADRPEGQGQSRGSTVATTAVPGVCLLHYPVIDSTNDEARRLARAGAIHGTAIWSDAQTRGRGRQGREWTSPRGNMYLTLLLHPERELAVLPQMSFVTAIAVADTVSRLAPSAPVSLKWPNDVLVDGAKISGILLETEAGGPDGKTALLVGCGLNIGFAPSGTRYGATFLNRVAGGEVTVADAVELFLESLMRWFERWRREGFAVIRDAWMARAHGLGRIVSVQLDDELVEGVFSGLSRDGSMLLTDAEGRRREIQSGDVLRFLETPCC